MQSEIEHLAGQVDGCVVTIGNFDGVNRAHQHLVAQGALFAANLDRPLVVLTFDRHPLTLLNPARAPAQLTLLHQKVDLLHAAGADHVAVINVTSERLAIEADAFVRDYLVGMLRMSGIVEGPNFGFGHNRTGNIQMLADMGTRWHFFAKVVEPLEVYLDVNDLRPQFVSSTLCRRLIAEGKVRRASFCLGRRYSLLGRVGAGVRRGRTLGFPTINLEGMEQLIPADGVYAGRACLQDGRLAAAAISIGSNPTFAGTTRQVEAHLLDFHGELYDQPVCLEFAKWLRPQQTFASAAELIEQISRDVADVRHWTAQDERYGTVPFAL